MFKRTISTHIREVSAKYKAIGLLGPRQSGKTTLAKMLFPKHEYYSLEDLDLRQRATSDPRGFLKSIKKSVILDEIQRAPDLLSYIQGVLDDKNDFQFTMSEHMKLFSYAFKAHELLEDYANKKNFLILNKSTDLDYLIELQKNVKKEEGIMHVLEGTDNYTIITQERYILKLYEKFENNIIKSHENLVIIDFKSPEEIEKITGVISYLTSLFAENGVNILEFLSCWRDTIFVIDKKDINKAIDLLNF